MRTVNYSEVLRGTAALAGLGAADIGTAEFALLRTYHDRRLQQAWEAHHWPEVCRWEQRLFRPLWNATYAVSPGYAAGAERYDLVTGRYFQSLVAANTAAPTVGGVENSAYWAECAVAYAASAWADGAVYAVGNKVKNPADGEYYQCISAHTGDTDLELDGNKWGLLTSFDRYVGYEQVEDNGTAHTVVGEFLRALDRSPYQTTKLVEFDFTVSENGAQFSTLKNAVTYAWVWLRQRRPELTGDAWDATAVYAAGDQVYYTAGAEGLGVGNFYEASAATVAGESPASTPAKWGLVELPYIFRGWMIQAGYADWLTGDGQGDKAVQAEGLAQQWLELEADKAQRQSGQVLALRWIR